ncbi:uncharacterized protein si:dkey-28a3.2 isoform X1 [Acanthopagrus latus]|uniref:uncharacterized protein si:dkey-28a3.2 isoform X1 n=1 Tax=Acanthopagrus latus TaxID=8177 RepID=UPI00187C3EC6|nr:uncharacterized protein si:dkey-28a3.2 isoform X1 [Acanthopagrus latus]XP_036968743.1 uncharacterized protein si:dkey-28a3.2 isoform X1 [Acanthopagrus latus]
MPTAKGKGSPPPHRYRPASEYDDATLAQKREYWRTKKREQRARLSERRRKPTQDSHGKKLLRLNASAAVNSCVAFSPPVQNNDESHKSANLSPASQTGNTVGDNSVEATESQKERWLQTMELNKVLSKLPASCSISAKAAGSDTATAKRLTARGAVSRAVTSPTLSGTQLNTSSSVPPVRVTRFTNGSSAKTTPQPCVSMQGATVPKMQQKAQVALRIQSKLPPTNVTTGMILVSSPCVPVSVKTEGKAANTSPHSGRKSALVNSQRAKGINNSQPLLESEEERAAKRREHWRIKKREQRAKMAAQLAKTRERTHGTEMMSQRLTAQKTGQIGATTLQHLQSQTFWRGQKQCPSRVRTSVASTKRESYRLQSRAASLAPVNLQTNQKAITSDVTSVKKPRESQRKPPSYVHLSNVFRGTARCKTPRQSFMEVQRNFMIQRSIRCKSPSLASVFGTRNIPKIDPNDTPEQIIAKRREYWRIKKREQRAKLSMEMKARLKEKDSLTRRVKRYQKILEEMRRARALTQSTGSTLTHASETIGGFIKEDGTVTINIPQAPTDHYTAPHKSEEELEVVCNNPPTTKPQPHPGSKRRSIAPIRVNHPPPLRPAQVKDSFPLPAQSINKPPRQLAMRPRSQLESTTGLSSHSLAIQSIGQLTLTHPQTPQNIVSGESTAGPNIGGCVMKMAVSSNAPSVLCLDQDLTEEERMARKREYWRIKKREQRAARAAQLKQGVLQARASVALQRRKAQRQVAASTLPLGRRFTNHAGNTQPLPNNSVPITPHASEIKQETDSMPAADLNSQPEQAICPDIKPPTSPSPPPAPQPESDPALNADSQATTLLAVASMKKLLEESLSTVSECKSEQTDIKIESSEEALEPEMKANLPQLFFEKDEVAPIAADLMLEIKSWQSDTDSLVQAGSPSLHLTDSPQTRETPPMPATSEDVVLHSTCEHSSQTPSNFIVNLTEVSDGPSSQRRTQRLRNKKIGYQHCCSPEPPKLHHLPMGQLQPQTQHCEEQCQAQEQCQNNSLPSAQRHLSEVMEHSGLTSLQRKREYWKLMKRQQRARLKERQTGKQGESTSRHPQKNIQAPGLIIINTVNAVNPPAKPALQPKPSNASLNAVTSIPTVLVVSPTTCNAEQSPDTLQVKLPITSVSCSATSEQNKMNAGPLQTESEYLGAPENRQKAMPGPAKWTIGSTDEDAATCLPTLKPPDNPLSSINLQPIEPPVQTLTSTLSPIKIPCDQLKNPTHLIPLTKIAPLSTLGPPKPIPGESDEDFLKRKREYWRIRKKEQRARKAIRDKGNIPSRANNLRAILPAQDKQTQDSGQWVSSSEESEHLISTSADTDLESFTYPEYTVPLEDESELLFAGYENNNADEGPVSDTVWRNRYLMDYDPLNQLLVCMVCGELQYSHNLDGVRAHIDEAHPDTLMMDPGEKQGILEAWDEQVSQRERFFTSQLQQHSRALAEAHNRNRIN